MKEIVEKLIKEKIIGTHLFLVSIEIKKNRIEIFLDGDCGVNINECASVNRYLHNRLEEMNVDTGDFIFEISSPGFDRNLMDERSLKKNVGRKIQIRNSQGKLLKGNLVLVGDKGVVLTHGLKNAGKEIIKYLEIKEAKVVI